MISILYLLAGAAISFLIMFFYSKARQTALRERLRAKEEELQKANETINKSEQQFEQKQQTFQIQIQQINNENRNLASQKAALEKETGLLRQQMENDNLQRQKQFGEQLRLVQQQLQNATQELLRQRSQELAQTNSAQMNAIIAPLKESIRDMHTAMEHNRDSNNKNTASLEKAIEEVRKQTSWPMLYVTKQRLKEIGANWFLTNCSPAKD